MDPDGGLSFNLSILAYFKLTHERMLIEVLRSCIFAEYSPVSHLSILKLGECLFYPPRVHRECLDPWLYVMAIGKFQHS
jgi:hypothetical protein